MNGDHKRPRGLFALTGQNALPSNSVPVATTVHLPAVEPPLDQSAHAVAIDPPQSETPTPPDISLPATSIDRSVAVPAPGTRWAYGARKAYIASLKAIRAEESRRSPIDRFLATLSALPSLNRAPIQADRIEAMLAASSPNSVRGFLSDIGLFGDYCRQVRQSAAPTQPATIIAYLRSRTSHADAKKRAKVATLKRIIASISRLHLLLDLPDPTKDLMVKLEMQRLRRDLGTVQKQARPLRFKGNVSDIYGEEQRGVSLKALMEGCGSDESGIRDRALLSVAYDTGLRASELVAIEIEHILPASDPDARLLRIPKTKGDPEGKGATAYLTIRSVVAVQEWLAVMADLLDVAQVRNGPLFRRFYAQRVKPEDPAKIAREEQIRRKMASLGISTPPVKAKRRKGSDPTKTISVGKRPLQPQAVTQIFKARVRSAWEAGLLPDIDRREIEVWVRGISAHSTRIGLNNDLFVAGEDIAGIMDALRWKSPAMPLAYNRNLAAEHGSAGRVLSKLK